VEDEDAVPEEDEVNVTYLVFSIEDEVNVEDDTELEEGEGSNWIGCKWII
jgi:hypothetical protein